MEIRQNEEINYNITVGMLETLLFQHYYYFSNVLV